MKNSTTQNNNKQKLIFKSLAVFLPVILLIFIELLLLLFSYGNKMDLFIKHPDKNYKNYYTTNPKIGEKYFTKFEATGGTNDIFLRKKKDNVFRVFVLGSSTVVGFPYDKNLMFSRILHKRLQDSYPNKEIEMVNTAITAINSITLKDYTKEVVKHKPDAILFYAGHNEFYGAFGIGSNESMNKNDFVRNLHFKMMKFRTYQLVKNTISNIAKNIAKSKTNSEDKGSLMKRIVGDQEIFLNGEKYNIGIQQYISNVSDILILAQKNNVPVFISDLVSNVKDLPPFIQSDSTITNEALNLYKLAKNELSNNNIEKAKELFYKAKDTDPIRFRASEDINRIIDSLAHSYNCIFVPTKELFMNASANGLIGDNFLTEHVHPNIDGQFLLANSFYNKIVESKLIGEKINTLHSYKAQYYRDTWAYTSLDSLIGDFRIKQLKSYWPFAPLSNTKTFRDTYAPLTLTDSLAFSALQNTSPNIGKLHNELGKYYFNKGEYSKALDEYEAMIYINPYWSNYYNEAVKCLLKLSDLYKAEEYLKKSVKYKETYYAHLMLAEIMMIKHNFNVAIENYEKAETLAQTNAQKLATNKKLYLAYHYNNDNEKRNELKKILNKDKVNIKTPNQKLQYTYSNYIPHNVKDLINKAKQKMTNSQPDSALYYLIKSTTINDTPVANRYIGDILLQKQNNKLLYYYLKALPAYENELPFLSNLCIAYFVNKKTEEAKTVLQKMKMLDQNYASIKELEKMVNKK